MNPRYIAASIFILSYILFVVFPRRRAFVAIGGSLLLLLTQTLTVQEAFSAVNWNVMGIFVGMFFMADIFMKSRVPAYLAELIVNHAKNTCWAILLICIFTSFLSAFVENVATVLIIAPIAFSLAKRLHLNPMNMLFAVAISSNLQGAATLIGDPPSMLLAGFAKMNFNDFFWYQGKPSIFFAVQLGGIASFGVLYWFFKKEKEKTSLRAEEQVHSWVPTFFLGILIVLLAFSSFVDQNFSYLAGLLCMVFGVLSLVWNGWVHRESFWGSLRVLDWDTTFFLAGVFILVGGITLTGWIEVAAEVLSGWVGHNLLFGYILLIVVSVAFSAFIDNVPFLATMLPVALSMSAKLGIAPPLFLFALLIGASLGGNITPIGASANIVACGQLKKEGHEVAFGQFVQMGLPFTIAAVVAASLWIWFVWAGV